MMNGQQQEQPRYDGNMKLAITMRLGEWQQLMQVLIEAAIPWKVANPLVVQIEKQVTDFLQTAPRMDEQPERSEGVLPPGMNRG